MTNLIVKQGFLHDGNYVREATREEKDLWQQIERLRAALGRVCHVDKAGRGRKDCDIWAEMLAEAADALRDYHEPTSAPVEKFTDCNGPIWVPDDDEPTRHLPDMLGATPCNEHEWVSDARPETETCSRCGRTRGLGKSRTSPP